MPQELSLQRTVLGSKGYEGGNHVWVTMRRIVIEYDSDYNITRMFRGKNWFKTAKRQAERIPDPVSVSWLLKNGYTVPQPIQEGKC